MAAVEGVRELRDELAVLLVVLAGVDAAARLGGFLFQVGAGGLGSRPEVDEICDLDFEATWVSCGLEEESRVGSPVGIPDGKCLPG